MTPLAWFLFITTALVAVAAAIDCLHRLGLYLERRGLLYYRDKQPTSSAAGCFVAARKFIEPGMRHVIELNKNEEAHKQDAGDPENPPAGRTG